MNRLSYPDRHHGARGRWEQGDRTQRGSAMLMAIFVLALLGAAGIALLFLSQNEVKMSQGSLRAKRAFYLAEAGQEDGRATLYTINGTGAFTDDLKNYAGPNDRFDFDPDALQLVYDADGNVTGVTGFGDDRPLRGVTGFANGWYAAFLTNDPDEDKTTTDDANDLVMITGVGAGPDRSLEVVQAIVERWEVIPQLPPATITLLGPSPTFEGGHADPHQYSGDDCGGRGGVPGLYVPVVGTTGSSAEADAERGIYYDEITDEGPDYDSGPYEREDTFADLTDPTEPILADQNFQGLHPMWTDCELTRQFIEDMRSVADVICTSSDCVIPPAAKLIFVDGDYEINPPGGAATLLCTGTLTYDGRATWEGMIFAFGRGEFVRNGAGNGYISGAIMVADIAGPDNIYGTADDCTGGDNGYNPVSYLLNGGGNADTQYCTDHILGSKPDPPYRIVNFRQR